VKTSDFDYSLPPELIAQTPLETRDRSRLMVLDRQDGSIAHRHFFELTDYLREGDVLVFNDSRVIPARLFGRRVDTGGKVEMLLLRRREANVWEVLARHARRLHPGTLIEITGGSEKADAPADPVFAEITGQGRPGIKLVRFSDETKLNGRGEIPLPPYIHTPLADPERYQTVYSKVDGSVASTTAGLHFVPEMLKGLEKKGVQCLFVTLHIGLDTFSPVRVDDPREHHIHTEDGFISQDVAARLTLAKQEGRRIICVGTTAVRIVEQAAQSGDNPLSPFAGPVNLFILPGYRFRIVDAMITNFHLPRSTLLMLVAAFTGQELIAQAYQAAIAARYRFYSFGDAMLIL
jgi:S-adenosylmethionine:tRNA ribosyltransferase-isomerase